jgi:hypothetical protein
MCSNVTINRDRDQMDMPLIESLGLLDVENASQPQEVFEAPLSSIRK